MDTATEVLAKGRTSCDAIPHKRAESALVNPIPSRELKHTHTQALLVRCIGCAHKDTSQPSPDPVNWQRLVSAACSHWLGGLILEAAERHRWPVPELELQEARWQARQIRHNNLNIMQGLARIAAAIREQGVELLLLKGAALNLTLYDQPHLRPMSDLDLMMRPEKADRAAGVLEALGCRRGPGLVRDDFFPRFHYEVEYTTDDPEPVRIDLHVRPFRPMRYAQLIPGDAFWQRSRLVEVDGIGLRVPADEDQLVHLATHSACHGHSRLLWLYDIRRLVDSCGDHLDWDRVVHISKQWRLVLPVRQTVSNAERLWGPLCPDHVRRALDAEPVNWRDRLCLAQAPHDASHPVRHVAVNLLCTRGVRFRLAYLSRMLLPGRDHIGQVYHRRHPGWLLCGHLRRWLRATAFLRYTS